MTEWKVTLIESQELQVLSHNKNVKQQIYRPGNFVWLSRKHIKTKKNLNLKHKYLGHFEILEVVEKHAYKLNLPSK